MQPLKRMIVIAVTTTLTTALAVLSAGSAQAIRSQNSADFNPIIAPPATRAEAVAFADAVEKIEPSVRRNDDGTLSIATTAAGAGISEDSFHLISASVDALNQLVQKGELVTAENLSVSEPGDVPRLTHNGVNVYWWGIETHLDSYWTNKLVAALFAGSSLAALVALLAPAVGTRFAAAVAVAVLGLGGSVIQFCSNSRGVIIVKPHVGPGWCRGH